MRDAELRSDDVGSFVEMLLFYFNLHKAVLDEIPALGCFRLKYPNVILYYQLYINKMKVKVRKYSSSSI